MNTNQVNKNIHKKIKLICIQCTFLHITELYIILIINSILLEMY